LVNKRSWRTCFGQQTLLGFLPSRDDDALIAFGLAASLGRRRTILGMAGNDLLSVADREGQFPFLPAQLERHVQSASPCVNLGFVARGHDALLVKGMLEKRDTPGAYPTASHSS
jgi:hypothetical protein